MKTLFLFCGLLYSSLTLAQLKTTSICPELEVNILHGRIGVLDPNSTITQIKEKFPCFTSAEDEIASSHCGGGVFYKNKDIYFYTDRNYIEIGPSFKGKLSIPLMGASRNNLFKWLGHPMIKDVN
jgi:hypothetical protein